MRDVFTEPGRRRESEPVAVRMTREGRNALDRLAYQNGVTRSELMRASIAYVAGVLDQEVIADG